MKPQPTKEIAQLARASCANPTVTLRANGAEITKESRDEMLKRCMAGEYVELELGVLAFEQKPGAQNRNFIRFRDGALMALGRSGVGTPFLRDHDQDTAMARGGTVIASQTEKLGEGDYAVRQTVKLTAPWACELALRGLLSTVSIGWHPTGMVQCSVCSADFYRCSHMPGRRYSLRESEDGQRIHVPDPAGALVCERVYTEADLIETSAVNVPAVPSAHIDAIRAALRAFEPDNHEEEHMNPKLIALLGLAATAGDSEVLAAVEKLKSAAAIDAAELAIVKAELGVANAELETARTLKKKSDEDKFIADGIARGAIAPGTDEKMLREFYKLSPEKAAARLAERPNGSVTPVGQPRQTAGAEPAEPTVTASKADEVIAKSGGSGRAAIKSILISMGISAAEADKQIDRHLGGAKEA